MSLIQAGGTLRRQGVQGFGAAADIESRENTARSQLESAKFAQKMNTIGTGGGIGAMYGLKSATAGAAGGGGGGIAPTLQTLASTSPEGGISVLKGLEGAANLAPNTLGTTTASVGGAGAAGGGAAGGGAAAGSSTGFLGTLGAIAAPIAIGLGVAYLISELFD